MSYVEKHRRLVFAGGALLGFGVLSAVFFVTNRRDTDSALIGGRQPRVLRVGALPVT
jgi:hypothetical protein